MPQKTSVASNTGCEKNITAYEPEDELLGPEDLEHDVAVINRCVQRRQVENLVREAVSESGTQKLMESLISAGVCKDEDVDYGKRIVKEHIDFEPFLEEAKRIILEAFR